jgi:hypothetical protein
VDRRSTTKWLGMHQMARQCHIVRLPHLKKVRIGTVSCTPRCFTLDHVTESKRCPAIVLSSCPPQGKQIVRSISQ